MSVPPEAATPPPAAAGGADDKTLVLLTHLSGIFFGFLVPLIVWLVNKDNPAKAYLTDESKEALNFQLTVLIAWVVSGILVVVLIGFLLLPLVGIANLVFCIIAAVQVNSTGSYRYPFALRLIK